MDINEDGHGSLQNNAIEPIVDGVTDLMSGYSIPAPLRRNAFKALGQLCSALVDIPVAHLEGFATQKRAETQARVQITQATVSQIISQVNVSPEYAHIASDKYAQRIIREQINKDRVCQVAAEKLKQDFTEQKVTNDKEHSIPSINDEWLNDFEREVSSKSSDEMQFLFGRILAGEIQRPGAFSIKTIRLLGSMDQKVAELFKLACSLSLSIYSNEEEILDAKIITFGLSAFRNGLGNYGLSLANFNILIEYGLIMPIEMEGYYLPCIADYNSVIPFKYGGKQWCFQQILKQTNTKFDPKAAGPTFTQSGKELLRIVTPQVSELYTEALKNHFKNKNLRMIPFPPN